MKKRIIFYIIFSTFHLFLFFFSLYVDSKKDDLSFLLTLQSKIWMLKYASLFGLLLLVIDLLWDRWVLRKHKQEKDQLQHEVNALKAKLFDMQETAKQPAPQSAQPKENK